MNLTDALNEKLETLLRDYNNLHGDLQVCLSNIKRSRNPEEIQQVLDFIDVLKAKMEEKKQEIEEMKTQIQVVMEAEKNDFKKEYSEEEALLLRNTFEANLPLYQNNTDKVNNDLDGLKR